MEYFFGQRKVVPAEFAEWLAPDVSAAVSIDMHRGYLDDSPECPCPAPRASEIIEPINVFHRAAEFQASKARAPHPNRFFAWEGQRMSESNKVPQIRGPADYHSIPIYGDPPASSSVLFVGITCA